MNLIQSLKQGALSDEQKLHRILDRRENVLENKAKLSHAEESWNVAIEDGVVDTQEQNQLRKAFQNAGLGDLAKRLAGKAPMNGDALDKLGSKVDRGINKKRQNLDQAGDKDRLEGNLLMNEIQLQYKTAADVLKTKHQTYKSVIDNLKA